MEYPAGSPSALFISFQLPKYGTSSPGNIKLKHKTEDHKARDHQWIIVNLILEEEIDAAVDALEAAIELIRSGQGAGRQRVGGGSGPNHNDDWLSGVYMSLYILNIIWI